MKQTSLHALNPLEESFCMKPKGVVLVFTHRAAVYPLRSDSIPTRPVLTQLFKLAGSQIVYLLSLNLV